MTKEIKDQCPECFLFEWRTNKPEVILDSVGRPKVVQSQVCENCGFLTDVENVEQFCPCCESYIGS